MRLIPADELVPGAKETDGSFYIDQQDEGLRALEDGKIELTSLSSKLFITKLKPVDAIVVGIGISGSIIAMELVNAGLKVVRLERGRSTISPCPICTTSCNRGTCIMCSWRGDEGTPTPNDSDRETHGIHGKNSAQIFPCVQCIPWLSGLLGFASAAQPRIKSGAGSATARHGFNPPQTAVAGGRCMDLAGP